LIHISEDVHTAQHPLACITAEPNILGSHMPFLPYNLLRPQRTLSGVFVFTGFYL
jgi:hypothetical protein